MAKRKRYDEYMLLVPGEEVPGRSTRYVLERVVGHGAFGAVYAAHDPATPGRQIALKEFFPARHPRDQAPLKELFDRERLVGMQASTHPLMPTFYEAFQNDGYYYIAQEFIVGTTLDEIVIKRHPLPSDWILKWAVCLCDALAFLHSRQIVHHDLKPANIRITPQGHLALLDFGAAQYFGAGYEDQRPIDLYGTEGYLPPELESDGKWVADVRTDIFALGCILYEMIAGVAPDQEQINERSMYVTNTLIRQPNADLKLVRLINKAISYNTEYRYGSANDFLLELRAIAPPVLLVSRKHMRFGEVGGGQKSAPLSVALYNAGGGIINGEIKARSPWIVAPTPTFQGNHHEVPIYVDTNKIAERETLVTGRLEINSADQRDADGKVLFSGDRWFIECSICVAPRPGFLALTSGAGKTEPQLTLTGRKGQTVSSVFNVQNIGEQPIEYRVGNSEASITGGVQNPIEGMTVSPLAGTLGAGKTATVTVAADLSQLPPGVYETLVTVRNPGQQTLNVPVTLRVQSPFDYLKSKMSKQ